MNRRNFVKIICGYMTGCLITKQIFASEKNQEDSIESVAKVMSSSAAYDLSKLKATGRQKMLLQLHYSGKISGRALLAEYNGATRETLDCLNF